jgi:hypothetical protein
MMIPMTLLVTCL